MKEKRDIREEKRHRRCRICKGKAGLVRKYGLNICRRCFKDVAEKIGFKKFD